MHMPIIFYPLFLTFFLVLFVCFCLCVCVCFGLLCLYFRTGIQEKTSYKLNINSLS